MLADAGFVEAGNADAMLRDLARSPGVRGLSDSTRARLDRVLPALLQAAAASTQPMLALRRLLALLHNVLRRSAYLALLDEQPAALARLVEVVSHSALLAERLATYPLLLDELLDARVAGPLPDREQLHAACLAATADDDGDVEATLQASNEVRQALSFRIAMAVRDRRQPAADSARQLAWLADAVVERVLALAEREVAQAHGRVPGARFAVLGYGSLGGEELGFGSDLDLVFLYDADRGADGGDVQSDGARPLDAARWFARLAQKVVALLGAVTAAGRLFDVDVRLRPDGAKGLLVSSLASFTEYQRERAWTWEHQALVRARCISGDAGLCADYEQVRAQTLARVREPAKVREDVVAMRRRMRAELDRSDAAAFDLKQGEGGLVDLEFLLQASVLVNAAAHPALLAPRNTPGLVDGLRQAAVFDDGTAARLQTAHATLLERGLECTLDRRPRRLPLDESLEAARAAIRGAAHEQGLLFRRVVAGSRARRPHQDFRPGEYSQTQPRTHLGGDACRFAQRRDRERGERLVERPHPALRDQCIDEEPRPTSQPIGTGYEHRHVGGAGLRQHVDRVGGADDAVGPAEQAGIGIGPLVGAGPDQSGPRTESLAQARHDRRRRAPRRRDQQAAAVATQYRVEARRQRIERGFVERRVGAGAAQQHGGQWPWQLADRRKRGARLRQPQVVDRIEAAEQGDDVVATQAVVLGRDHQVPVSGGDARVEDLHRARAGAAQQPGRQRRLAAAADRERGRVGQGVRELRAERACGQRQPPWCDPAPGRAWRQPPVARRSDPAPRRGLAPGVRCRRDRRSGSRQSSNNQLVVASMWLIHSESVGCCIPARLYT